MNYISMCMYVYTSEDVLMGVERMSFNGKNQKTTSPNPGY